MTDVRLIEYEPGRWRVDRREIPVARSTLPMPMVISDEMDPVEQVDGRFYTSKSAFRRVGRSLGLTEVGNQKFHVKRRSTDLTENKRKRQETIRNAWQRVRGV